MCGACGSRSAQRQLHWASPLLASPPARAAAALSLTRWIRAGGDRLHVTSTAAGYSITGPTGRSDLAADLAAVVSVLNRYRVDPTILTSGQAVAAGIGEGRPTIPRPRPHTRPQPPRTSAHGTRLPAHDRKDLRIPAMLAWLSVAEPARSLGQLTLDLTLDEATSVSVRVQSGRVIVCETTEPVVQQQVWSDRPLPAALLTILQLPLITRAVPADAHA